MLAQLVLMTLAQAGMPSLFESWEVPSFEVVDEAPRVFLVSREHKADCPAIGSVCVSSGGSATVLGFELADDGSGVTVLARGSQMASKSGLATVNVDQPWQVEMVARFRARSESGPIVVGVFDRDDAQSIARKEPMAMWNVTMSPGRSLGMSFLLSPAEGFEPSHTYLVQVVQVQGARDRVLAEGTVHLE
jgi:hypothetical protein